jgi:hypothetical protein
MKCQTDACTIDDASELKHWLYSFTWMMRWQADRPRSACAAMTVSWRIIFCCCGIDVGTDITLPWDSVNKAVGWHTVTCEATGLDQICPIFPWQKRGSLVGLGASRLLTVRELRSSGWYVGWWVTSCCATEKEIYTVVRKIMLLSILKKITCLTIVFFCKR